MFIGPAAGPPSDEKYCVVELYKFTMIIMSSTISTIINRWFSFFFVGILNFTVVEGESLDTVKLV